MADAADTAISVAQAVGNAARLALKIGGPALPIIEFMAGFIPGLAPVVKVLEIASPILDKIVAGVPIAAAAINSGRPIIDALTEAGPAVLSSIKELYAISVNHDPAVPVLEMKAEDVSDELAGIFAAHIIGIDPPGWTHQETLNWWKFAQGNQAA